MDGDLADALGEQNRAHHDGETEEEQKHELDGGAGRRHAVVAEVALPGGEDRLGKTRGDVDHDDERRAVADAERRDLVGDPHHEERGGGHADHRHHLESEAGVGHDLHAAERGREHLRMHEGGGNSPRLDDAEENRQVAGDLRELLTARLPFLLHFFERRNHGGKELDHDLRRDVGPNREEADCALVEAAAGEHVEPVEKTAARGGADIVYRALKRLPIDARCGNLGDETAHRHQTQSDENLLAQFGNPERVRKTFPHRHIFAPLSF